MEYLVTRPEVEAAAQYVRTHSRHQPEFGIVLGSGLSALAEAVQDPDLIPFREIPNFPVSSVVGHSGRLVIGKLEGRSVLVMQGRVHFYEGYSMSQVTLPIRMMKVLGINTVILTNAAGGLNRSFKPGDVMLITDHINLVGMAGQNPLRGPNDDSFGPRFPDMSQPYDRGLRELALKVAAANQVSLQQGVYIGLAGPSFESPADVRFLRVIGADAVGMSTVPETIVARHAGMRVLGLSGISNALSGEEDGPQTTHEEVLEAGRILVPRMMTVIRGVLSAA
ncbi:MAG TPA: purine-nucleoside phosphorylase [Anaerolineae bacterium]|nr:purine-nucleoside phosphorylase [Anaerolineae bacterium]